MTSKATNQVSRQAVAAKGKQLVGVKLPGSNGTHYIRRSDETNYSFSKLASRKTSKS